MCSPGREPVLPAGVWSVYGGGLLADQRAGFGFDAQRGARSRHTKQKWYTGREVAIDLFVSLAYTALIVLLLRSQVLKPIEDYLR